MKHIKKVSVATALIEFDGSTVQDLIDFVTGEVQDIIDAITSFLSGGINKDREVS